MGGGRVLGPPAPLANRRNNNCNTPLHTFATTWAVSAPLASVTVRVAMGFVLIIELIMCVCDCLWLKGGGGGGGGVGVGLRVYR